MYKLCISCERQCEGLVSPCFSCSTVEKGSKGNCKLLYLWKLGSSYLANLALETKTRMLPSEKFSIILVRQQESCPFRMD